ncbi:MAG: cysteine desulfurase [Coriobacteriaceae bacterium]|jgi:cysteine desulfurase|nr:cysteine desulfurase [Atopobiaceae bacterium]MCI1343993.1 cysteine desulfurase [Atopobiaceae bacterium]MDY5004617.1 cysteine desulfurase family protein [Atopobiaceae bacterium]RRF95592.1 MAG: cysteine desulfurase [Coriobacteriaceae bacterium]
MDSYVYLDYAASAPMVPEAKAAEAAYAEAPYAGANPNSLHTLGREAAMALEGARREIAKALGGGFRPGEIVFTSGGTESNNLALYGIAEGARARDRKRTRVVVSAIEHDSELDVVPALKDRGFAVTLVRPGRDGRIAPEELERAVGPDCALVSIMSANNETGVIQPVAELAEIAHKAGALMHTDAVQAFGRIPLAIDTCDAVSIAAHKIGGPVGIGALALRMRCPFRPQNFGGGQEAGKRPGTQDVRGALAFAAAAKAQTDHLAERRSACAAKANRLFQKICAPGTGIQPTTTAQIDDTRLPGMVSIYVPGLDSETLILKLDQKGFEVSAGSACSSGSLDPSHVLSAMGIARNDALGALRISFDERVSDEDLDRFADALIGIVAANN